MEDERSRQGGEGSPQESAEYPGPRKSSTGETVAPDLSHHPGAEGAGAREGQPSASGGAEGTSTPGPDARDLGMPLGKPGEAPRTDFPRLPHRDSNTKDGAS